MNKPLFQLKDVVKTVHPNGGQPLNILDHVNLDIHSGDFITILGSNGAGKSTLFNAIGGNLPITSGHILLNGNDITKTSVTKRTQFLSRVFQDPKLGTAPRMTVAENLLLAEKRGQSRFLVPRHLKREMAKYQQLTSQLHNHLSERLNTPTGNLSGGQRQTLSFLMATIKKPEILLLDEHTAALDPNTSNELMALTEQTIKEQHLTCLMITHHLDDALKYGNRLLVLNQGQIEYDFSGSEKQAMTKQDLYQFFNPAN
ncbi:ATP-binding cassette domain-containing protein [Nicoliella spurrieriana]|uniref:ATP-binding cassette domain-containing protein n=1 Tax=Nicoliella spurrieriana TaxID=2925830 RepID=A0A976X4T0_9LACO|nr:ATP-binding cassette domain-containing protein [Nicoliella spurrieriana]UQS86293.1 ATP-binding cassette domain-containing protein [Nicoliella spurrieriana]